MIRFRPDAHTLTPAEREEIFAWLRLHDIDPRYVPEGGLVELDGDEYRIETMVPGPGGGALLNADRTAVLKEIVRRPAKAPLPRWMVVSG